MADTISYNFYVDHSPDDNIWRPISSNEKEDFLQLIQNVREAFHNGTKQQKGQTLEILMTYIYQRFKHIHVYDNVQRGDNQIDHIIEFIDGMTPTFIHHNIGLTLVGESKNHNKSISVREVADLNELLRSKYSKLGIFSSYKSFSKGKSLWHFAEGKRRKLALSDKRVIIGFNINELESLTENNFYTMLKQKYQNIVDEIEDDYSDENIKLPYHDRLFLSLKNLHERKIIDETSYQNGIKEICSKYGETTLDT
ncbi:hypothetical protein COF81_16575 [Bacillus pseudomycoides]|uniref:Restriction endonuclease type IV Mrr domain-containing protein n=1 Tax=Bacillus pseudomycoides TaxID=64104 RepID=A0ABD6T4Q0_9BACI|nr:hypothetical protein [Bacillus pseudomycoides]PEK39097.1 hypothetical protein CN691_03980 [Bacillus pseudomycoides]PHE94372.1 hypothetical protein COF81_16575 [Bacillus pseudomycoides]